MTSIRRRFNLKPPSERQAQITVVQYLRTKYPDVLFWATPNGGSRNAIEAANLKKEGVRAGVPDLFIAYAQRSLTSDKHFSCGLFIEMKSAKGKLSDSQIDIMNKLSAEGYQCEVCYSVDEAIKVIDEYLS